MGGKIGIFETSPYVPLKKYLHPPGKSMENFSQNGSKNLLNKITFRVQQNFETTIF